LEKKRKKKVSGLFDFWFEETWHRFPQSRSK